MQSQSAVDGGTIHHGIFGDSNDFLAVCLVCMFLSSVAVGSTVIALNNFIFPAWFHLLLNGKNLALHEKVINVEILVMGIVGALAGTYASILGIMS